MHVYGQPKKNRLSSARSGQIEIVSEQVYVDVIPFPDYFCLIPNAM